MTRSGTGDSTAVRSRFDRGVTQAGWPRTANPLVHWCGVPKHRS
jgi:hypothetical protein